MEEAGVKIIIAIIGLIGVVSTAYFGRTVNKKSEARANQAEREMKFQRAALDFGTFLSEWSDTHKDIEKLLSETEIDRFIILRAWNGHLEPRWTTAVFQMRLGNQEPVSYVHFELDTDYVNRLRNLTINGISHFKVDEIADSAIKRVYEAEGVNSSVWCHLISESTPEGASVHTYCSFGTKEYDTISKETITKCRILAGRLKGVASAFNS